MRMIVTAWITPPRHPQSEEGDPQPGIERKIFKEDSLASGSLKFDIEVRIRHTRPDVQVDFGPVSVRE